MSTAEKIRRWVEHWTIIRTECDRCCSVECPICEKKLQGWHNVSLHIAKHLLEFHDQPISKLYWIQCPTCNEGYFASRSSMPICPSCEAVARTVKTSSYARGEQLDLFEETQQ